MGLLPRLNPYDRREAATDVEGYLTAAIAAVEELAVLAGPGSEPVRRARDALQRATRALRFLAGRP